MERIHKAIANYGYCSRREAEKLIKNKKVYVNDKLITELGTKVTSTDLITIDGILINKEIQKKYYLLHKPRSVVSSASDDKNRITVVDLIDTNERIYSVGRLDYDTTGIIILTNDGEFANYLMHPKNEIKKTYLVKIEGILDANAIKSLKNGVVVDNKKVNIVNFKIRKKNQEKKTSFIELTIIEGRNHIVKNIFKELGYSVEKLTRTGYGHLKIDNLKSGEYRELTIKETKTFYANKNC